MLPTVGSAYSMIDFHCLLMSNILMCKVEIGGNGHHVSTLSQFDTISHYISYRTIDRM